MSTSQRKPDDLGIRLDELLAYTPCWIVYRASLHERVVTACELLPELLASPRRRDRVAEARQGPTLPVRSPDPARGRDRQILAGAFDYFDRLQDPAAADHALKRGELFARSQTTGSWWLVMADDAEPIDLAPAPEAGLTATLRAAGVLAKALSFLHEAEIWHLDVAPAALDGNRLAYPPGLPLRKIGRGKPDDHFLTREDFSPPELYDYTQSGRIGPWTDIYMASATLYTLATGSKLPPLKERPKSPEADRREIVAALADLEAAPGLVDAIAAGLSARIADRPATLQAWLDLIGPLQEPTTVEAEFPGTLATVDEDAVVGLLWTPGLDEKRRTPIAKFLAIAVAAVIALAGVYYVIAVGPWDGREAPAEPVQPPIKVPADPPAPIETAPDPAPAPDPEPVAEPPPVPLPETAPKPATPTLADLDGTTWTRPDSRSACDTRIVATGDGFVVSIKGLRGAFRHTVRSSDGGRWATEMTGAATGNFEVSLPAPRTLEMRQGSKADRWEQCDVD